MFERFSDEARSVVVLATNTSRANGNPEIEPLHLLHALAATCEDGLVGRLLKVHRLTPARLNEAMQKRRGSSHPTGHRPFSAESKAALEAALRCAMQYESHRIDGEHLLVGVLKCDSLRPALIELEVSASTLIAQAKELAQSATVPTASDKRQKAHRAAADGLALLAEALQLIIEEAFSE